MYNSIFLIEKKDFLKSINLEDKIYISCILTSSNHYKYGTQYAVLIDETCPIVALNQEVQKRFFDKTNGSKIDTIDDFKKQNSDYFLLSVGTLLFQKKDNNYFIAILKRDENAPTSPNRFTEAAGRCSEHPVFSFCKEVNEELFIFNNSKVLYGISEKNYQQKYKSEDYDYSIMQIKENQISSLHKDKNIQSIRLIECENFISNLDFEITCIIAYSDRAESIVFCGPHYIDNFNKTVELRQALEMPYYINMDLNIFDGEEYSREVDFLSINTLKTVQKTHYLEYFCLKY